MLLAAAALFIAATAPQPARADYAVLRGGQRLHITGWQSLGDAVRLDLTGGSVTISAAELAGIEPEEIFGASAERARDVPYAAQIRSAAETYGVDPGLVASIISAESNFNSRAISRRSALGLMQLRPETAAQMAVRNAFDAKQNIDGGTRYLKLLLDRYGQDVTLALAAYNAGPKPVDLISRDSTLHGNSHVHQPSDDELAESAELPGVVPRIQAPDPSEVSSQAGHPSGTAKWDSQVEQPSQPTGKAQQADSKRRLV